MALSARCHGWGVAGWGAVGVGVWGTGWPGGEVQAWKRCQAVINLFRIDALKLLDELDKPI